MVRLKPMDATEFLESLARSVQRHADDSVRRGIWTREHALEASRAEYDRLLPQGLATPHFHLCRVIDTANGASVGETWYTVREKGGNLQFWVDWIWIEPEFRRRGFANQVLEQLEAEARQRGADRFGLNVSADNPAALALYGRFGFVPVSMHMIKFLPPTP
ncbi:MAG TPA: GNAT family N-acetyltransferase [Thermoplasmata archaeon]